MYSGRLPLSESIDLLTFHNSSLVQSASVHLLGGKTMTDVCEKGMKGQERSALSSANRLFCGLYPPNPPPPPTSNTRDINPFLRWGLSRRVLSISSFLEKQKPRTSPTRAKRKRFISQWLYTMHESGLLHNIKIHRLRMELQISNVIRAKVNRNCKWRNPKLSERRIMTYRFSMTANQNGIFKSNVSLLAMGRHRFSQDGIKYLKNISQPSRFRHIIGQQERWNRHLLEGSYKTTGRGAGQGRNVMFQLEYL